MFLQKHGQKYAMSFAAMTHLVEGLCLNALLTLKVENALICLVGTRITSVHDGMTINFALENVNNK
jgi:hypothetical protein